MDSPRKLKQDQAIKVHGHYSTVLNLVNQVGSLLETPSASGLETFDKVSSQLRTLTSSLGDDDLLNSALSDLPRLLSDTSTSLLDYGRMVLLDPRNAARKDKCMQKKAACISTTQEILSKLGVYFNTSSGSLASAAPGKSLSDSQKINLALRSSNSGDVDRLDQHGRTALMNASATGKLDIVKQLLQKGARWDLQDNYGCHALLMAASKGHFVVCKALLDAGADPRKIQSKWASSAVDYLVTHNPSSQAELDVFSVLIDRGHDVNYSFPFMQGDTLLMVASARSNVMFVKMLLGKPGIQVNATNRFGETAVHKAARVCSGRSAEVISHLIAAGAATDVQGANGTPASVVPPNGKHKAEILAMLKPSSGPENRITDGIQRLTIHAKGDLFDMLDKLMTENRAAASNNNSMNSSSGRMERSTGSIQQVTSPTMSHQGTLVSSTRSPMLRVDPEVSAAKSSLVQLDQVFEPYRLQFFKKVHVNFVSWELLTIVSFMFTAKDGFHKALVTSPDGHQVIDIKEDLLLKEQGSNLKDKMLSYLQNIWFPNETWHMIDDNSNKQFQLELLGLEASHATNASAFRIAIVYCHPGQTTEEQFFTNTKTSPAFETFLGIMGERVSLDSFSGFSGGFGEGGSSTPTGTSYYVSWLNLEIMYHVAPLMTADEQRRLIGNDLVIIYWTEQDEPFKPLEFRGSVNSIGIVVKPVSDNEYRVGCFARRQVRDFGPSITGANVPSSELRNFVLTKAINGVVAAQKSPPFAKMIASLYSADIEKILEGALPKKITKKKRNEK